MITRRSFIKTTTLATVSALVVPGLLKCAAPRKYIGLQLYTVREQMKKDLLGTLQQVARIGYTWLEAAGYKDGKFYGMIPAEFKAIVNDLGMKLISSHVAFNKNQSQQVIDAHLELGVPYVVYPWMSMPDQPSKEDYYIKADLFNELGESCKNAGLKFGYHNHDFEFVKINETTAYDILLERTEPGLVCMEADLYWMRYANVDPLHYFSEYPGRFELWHVKDMEDSPERDFAAVGEGTIQFAKYFNEATLDSGMKFFFVEQDRCKIDPLESIEISYKYLRTLFDK